jgi:hypothetical protein
VSAASNPVLFLSAETMDGEVCSSPLFAALQVTDSLVQRMRALEPLCRTYNLLSVRFEHGAPEPPVYWEEKPRSRMQDHLVEYVEWCQMDSVAQAILWGRLLMPDGGHGAIEPLARTYVVDLHQLAALRGLQPDQHPTGLSFSCHENWHEVVGCEFELEVLARVAELGREARAMSSPGQASRNRTRRHRKPP